MDDSLLLFQEATAQTTINKSLFKLAVKEKRSSICFCWVSYAFGDKEIAVLLSEQEQNREPGARVQGWREFQNIMNKRYLEY